MAFRSFTWQFAQRKFVCLQNKRTRRFPILVAVIFVLAANGISHAQEKNPLRNGETGQGTFEEPGSVSAQHTLHQPSGVHTHQDASMPPEVFAAIYNTDVVLQARNDVPIIDQQIERAGYEATPKNDLAPIQRLLNSLPNQTGTTDQARDPNSSDTAWKGNLREPAADAFTANLANETRETDSGSVSAKKFDRDKFQSLIKHLGINTGIVMCCGIGFILIAKQILKGKSAGKRKQLKPGIEIKSTLKLSPKSNLHLIEAGDQRLMVAMDQNGIRSVVRLTESFAHTLDSFEELVGDQESLSSEALSSVPTDEAGAYSLGAIGQSLSRQPPVAKSETPIQPEERVREPEERVSEPKNSGTAGDREAEVRRQMEAALSDHGLKELFLETLRKQTD